MRSRLDRHRDDEAAEREMQEFQDRHRSFSDRVERLIMRVVLLGLLAVGVVQVLQLIPFVRRTLNYAEALDGVAPAEVAAWRGSPAGDEPAVPAWSSAPAAPYSVTVVLMSDPAAPAARLLVDGRVAGTFTGSTVTAEVRPGQTITVDGSRAEQALSFRVVAAPGLASPALGAEVRTNRDRQSLGRVTVANP